MGINYLNKKMKRLLDLLKSLIRCQSISPNDNNCQNIINDRLSNLGFHIESMDYKNVTNSYCWKGEGKTLAFSCHTDVVPIGNIKNWNSNPFEPVIKDNFIYGRGSADMKGSIASMIIAVEEFIKENPKHNGKLAFIITSDEEKDAKYGTIKIINQLINRKESIDYCIIGEPSSSFILGDVIKNGRRGSLNVKLIIKGIQGHVAYHDLCINPIHKSISFLNDLIKIKLDSGNQYFPPTIMQTTYINSGYIDYPNIIPEKIIIKFNFRFNTETNESIIRKLVLKMLKKHKIFNYKISWHLSGNPFFKEKRELIQAAINSIKLYQGIIPKIETTGGTSDGRFISLLDTQIVELGPVNKTIHKDNECVNLKDLLILSKIYKNIIEQIIL